MVSLWPRARISYCKEILHGLRTFQHAFIRTLDIFQCHVCHYCRYKLLPQLHFGQNKRVSYASGKHTFHVVIRSDARVFLCLQPVCAIKANDQKAQDKLTVAILPVQFVALCVEPPREAIHDVVVGSAANEIAVRMKLPTHAVQR